MAAVCPVSCPDLAPGDRHFSWRNVAGVPGLPPHRLCSRVDASEPPSGHTRPRLCLPPARWTRASWPFPSVGVPHGMRERRHPQHSLGRLLWSAAPAAGGRGPVPTAVPNAEGSRRQSRSPWGEGRSGVSDGEEAGGSRCPGHFLEDGPCSFLRLCDSPSSLSWISVPIRPLGAATVAPRAPEPQRLTNAHLLLLPKTFSPPMNFAILANSCAST